MVEPDLLHCPAMDLDPLVAAKWCKKHKIPPLPLDLYDSLQDLANLLLQGIHDDPDIPPSEVRVYYQSMKFILRTMDQQKFPR
jgi:hypothetical protein